MKAFLSSHRLLLAILIAGGLFRAAAALYMGDQVVDLPGTHDQISYNALAQNVFLGKGFTFDRDWYPFTPAGAPTAHWSFGYVLYLAGTYSIFGSHPLAARLIQAVIGGVLLCLLIGHLGRRLFGPAAGLIAASLTACYAYYIYYAAALMTETFYICALLVAFELTLDLAEKENPGAGRWIGLGLVLAAATLLRQVILLFVPFLFAWLVWKRTDRVRTGLKSLLSIGILILAILPWTWRNFLEYHRFLLLNSNSGYALWVSNHPDQGTKFDGFNLPLLPADRAAYNEAEWNDLLTAQGIQFILTDPKRIFLLSINKLAYQFIFWPSPESGTISNFSRVFSFGLCLPLMIYGLALSFKNWRKYSFFYLFIVVYNLIHIVTWPAVRYRLPVDAVLLVFAGNAVAQLVARAKQGLHPGGAAPPVQAAER